MLSYFVIFLYLVLLAYSLVVVYQRKTFDHVQKRIHAIISLVFPLWGILLKQFSDKPVEGSHFYPNKRNKYGTPPDHDQYNTDIKMMGGDHSHYGSDI